MEIKLKPRKVIQIGYSFLVTLPLIWLRHNKISKNDEIEMTLLEGNLIQIKPKVIDNEIN